MVSIPIQPPDLTLEAMRSAMEYVPQEPPREYLGASLIGHACNRHIWYAVNQTPRPPINSTGLMAIEDGHRTEELMIKRLRLIPGVTIWNEKENGDQYGFEHGRIKGHCDGIILGILEAPKTPHVLEIKCCNIKKFDAFKKLKAENEKEALRKWDQAFYAQAQLYMKFMELTRHYLVVATPGGRDCASARTDYDPVYAEALVQKGERILKAKDAPERIGDKSWYQCKWCAFYGTCHGIK